MAADGSDRRDVAAWDLPTRVFHWLLVALLASAWLSYEYSETLGDVTLVWHRYNGLAILTLLVWRLLWGVTGSPTSRFSSFVRSPTVAFAYGRDLIAGRARKFLGHNPLGAWMVVALLAALLTQAGFGLFAVDDNDLTGGPLTRLVSEETTKFATRWHGRVFDFVILPLAGLHIATNLFHAWVVREPLIKAMVSGRKPPQDYADSAGSEMVAMPVTRALVCLAAAAAIVFGGILAAGGRLF
ncbi:MAG: cytochrome b/b6 domain-containing protein [Hyphomicrobium sp.]